MSVDQNTLTKAIPKVRRRGVRAWWIGLAIVGLLGLGGALSQKYRSARFRSNPLPILATVEVDRGDVALVVTESGSLECADDVVIRNRVESFLGLPTGGPTAQLAQRQGSRMPSVSRSRVPGIKNAAIASPSSEPVVTSSRGGRGISKSKANTNSASTSIMDRQKVPNIRSFNYVVTPHIQLRGDLPPRTGPAPQPPVILSILPEGSRVKAGEVVCELDSSSFRDELLRQQVRHERMKAWVEQAKSMLEVDEISLREYEEGIYPQDVELIRQHTKTCEIEAERAKQALSWSRVVAAKGFWTQSQVEADTFTLLDAEVRLRVIKGMLKRLTSYTRTRIVKAHKAKIEATRADMLSLEFSFQLESDRLKRIEAMIANCTLRAPRAGIVVYANRSNSWGTVETQIREGLTVYESQPIFRMLDPRHMQVRARINESQVARIKSGLPALIRLDAFPDRPLRGTVAEITPIPVPANGPFSDVRAYFATVRIDSGGFDELRTGLSAEVEFLVETHRQVPRIPLETIRWVGRQAFAAIMSTTTTDPTGQWKPITLGATDTTFAEVMSGLEPGDQVVAHPELLAAPEISPTKSLSILALEERHTGL